VGYTAVRGGLAAISAAEELVRRPPLGSGEAKLRPGQIRSQLSQAVDKVMGEGGLYAPELAALAIEQAEGDLFEAAFLLRAYRSTLPRFGYSLPTGGEAMRVLRRISSAFKDIPGGQLLGRTRDYTQRLLDFGLLDSNGVVEGRPDGAASDQAEPANLERPGFPKVSDALRARGLVAPRPEPAAAAEPPDITLEPLRFPAPRAARLQALARGESGAMVCLAYSAMRGYGGRPDHATIAELRVGDLPLRMTHPATGRAVTVGWYRATEVELLDPELDPDTPGRVLGRYELSYGLVFGQHERKALAMATLDGTLGAPHPEPAPAYDQEMVLSHIDGIESAGFVEHLKLPHYVTFGSSLQAKAAERERGSGGHDHGDGLPHAHD
jgi:alpha-D-ribose 1-methylphosphonate 5-triphosphate synthase subunit PhnI